MVDAWNGIVQNRQDNLWWKLAKPDDGSAEESGEKGTPLKNMVQSIVAPVAMVDYGPNDGQQFDGVYDTAVVGDTKGQIWLARFYKPGVWDSTKKIITNWSGARAFEVDRDGIATGTDEDTGTATSSKSTRNDWPFYYVTETAVQPSAGYLRAFVGTGDRYSILEPGAGACRFDSPLPCSKYGCDEVKFVSKIKRLNRTSQGRDPLEGSQVRARQAG
jgi:type IV pilus assembly protein PilY1